MPEELQPPGHKAFAPDAVLWKLRNYLGGSWTAFLQAGGPPGESAEDGEDEEEEPRTAIDEICPLCLAARGDLRHVCLACQAERLPEIRHLLWDAAEAAVATAQKPWKLQRHPKRWLGVGSPDHPNRWPTLRELGWLLPTDHEEELAAGLAAGFPAEVGYDLGYRGVIPQTIVQALGKSKAPRLSD